MSKQKEKKIKKLRKKSIWPSILGLLFILCIFSCIIIAATASSCIDIVQRKISEGSEQAVKIASLYEDYDAQKGKNIQETILSYIALRDDTEAVCIMDKNDKIIWSSNGLYPDREKIAEINLQQVAENSEVRVIMQEDINGDFTIKGNEIIINDDFIQMFDILQLLNFDYIISNQNKNSVLEARIWFGVPANGLDVYVLNHIQVFTQDLFMWALRTNAGFSCEGTNSFSFMASSS